MCKNAKVIKKNFPAVIMNIVFPSRKVTFVNAKLGKKTKKGGK